MELASETIGIISIKGGVGKTTTVVNLASVLSNEFNKKVLVIDTNVSSPNLGLHLGLAEPELALHNVLENEILAREAIHKHEFGFDILPASLKGSLTNPLKLKEKIKGIKKKYDLVLLDTSPTINKELLAAMHASDKLFVVSTPDKVTLNMTLRATKVATEKGTPILGIILNRIRGKKYETTLDYIEKKSKTPVIAKIKENHKINESLHKTAPVVITNPHSAIAIEFKRLAAAIIDEEYKEPNFAKKILNYLREDLDSFKNHNFKKGVLYHK